MTTPVPCTLRDLIRADLPAILAIERASFPVPWTEEEFLAYFQKKLPVNGLVAEVQEQITGLRVLVGYLVFGYVGQGFYLLNLAVDPAWRRCLVASQLVAHLAGKLSLQRNLLSVLVSERNLGAQLFFRAQGFRAVSVRRRCFSNDEDSYRMEYRLEPTPAEGETCHNRIRHHL